MNHETFIASTLLIALFLSYVSAAAGNVPWARRTIAVVAVTFFSLAVIASINLMLQVVRS